MSNFFLSLFLAAFMSFAAPVILIGFILVFSTLIGYLPGLFNLGDQLFIQVLNFLAVFGNGKPLQGILTLGFTVSIVGILLDLLNIYRYQSLQDERF
ncbi:MAG: hypothetical protein QNJ53_01620 [Pleurocapsa sp. MO_192.B19]|nr:hypothetical protein [Pleurocapsa sp. MO_192.B19]